MHDRSNGNYNLSNCKLKGRECSQKDFKDHLRAILSWVLAQFPLFPQGVERFHPRGQQLCEFIATKDNIYII